MKRIPLVIASLTILMIATSCGTQSALIPKALNTVCTASLSDLNLTRSDYMILNTITAEAVVYNHSTPHSVKLEDPDGEFTLIYTKEKMGGLEVQAQWCHKTRISRQRLQIRRQRHNFC